MIIKMIKTLLIAVFVVACNAQDKKPIDAAKLIRPVDLVIDRAPICYGLKAAPAEELDESPLGRVGSSLSQKESSVAELTEADASKLLGLNDVSLGRAPTFSKNKRAASVKVNGATEARAALSKATGSIIAPILKRYNPCPSLLTFTSAGQDLCPSYQQLLTRFWSSNGNGYCYVFYPQWQRVYQTRCKCNTCRNSCPFYPFYKPGLIRFKNYCKPKSRRSRYVWALCRRNNSYRCIRERVTLNSGGCECRAYRTCF